MWARVVKNPLTAALAALCLLLAAAVVGQAAYRHFVSSPAQYRAGQADKAAEISRSLAAARAEQAAETLAKERKQAAALAAAQAEIEKEKQNAQTAVNHLRRELGRVQQYAAAQSGRRNLPAAAASAGAPDETSAWGWQLFGKCAAEYAAMAEAADHQRNDLAEWQAYGRTVSGD
ncbi:hypothetical protein [Neisseria musculi]|uniref:Uncharacterized protein n=1 Tax=Neisseria musculi TaxID=1815583 RepID=A0A7H1MBE5_9NEIS|nr:hypothetical protein [Neisseria musculi]QNT58960.1 hypothetical protein H7A79_1609 [Neisseria musculi]